MNYDQQDLFINSHGKGKQKNNRVKLIIAKK